MSAALQHTPGPWRAHQVFWCGFNGYMIAGTNGDTSPFICRVLEQTTAPTTTERAWVKANARLIAAAPAMLSALSSAYALLADIRHIWPGRETPEGQALLCAMRDAVSAATGQDGEMVSSGVRSELVPETMIAEIVRESGRHYAREAAQ